MPWDDNLAGQVPGSIVDRKRLGSEKGLTKSGRLSEGKLRWSLSLLQLVSKIAVKLKRPYWKSERAATATRMIQIIGERDRVHIRQVPALAQEDLYQNAKPVSLQC